MGAAGNARLPVNKRPGVDCLYRFNAPVDFVRSKDVVSYSRTRQGNLLKELSWMPPKGFTVDASYLRVVAPDNKREVASWWS